MNAQDIQQCLNELHIDAEKKEVEKLLKIIHFDEAIKAKNASDIHNIKTKEASFHSFANFVKAREALLAKIFHALDANEDGFLTLEDIQTSLDTLGFDVSTKEISRMLGMIDRDLDKKISFEEFRRFTLMFPSLEPASLIE